MIKRAALCVLLAGFYALPAKADAVDGDWCADDGRTLTIDGVNIRIPSGLEIMGEYSRHAFRYVGPAGDPEAAHDVRMFLSGDDVLRVERFIDGVEQPEEEWNRCNPIA